MKIKIETENHVKDKIVKPWYDRRGAWHYAPSQNGLGVQGIHDRIGCVPVVVTPEMVGKRIGLFVSVEAKAPGRRGEKDRGMSKHQANNLRAIIDAGGFAACCDSFEDIEYLERQILMLLEEKKHG